MQAVLLKKANPGRPGPSRAGLPACHPVHMPTLISFSFRRVIRPSYTLKRLLEYVSRRVKNSSIVRGFVNDEIYSSLVESENNSSKSELDFAT